MYSCISRAVGALRRPVRRLNFGRVLRPLSFVPRVITLQDVFVSCQAYGDIARVRLDASRPWCGGAVGMCIETIHLMVSAFAFEWAATPEVGMAEQAGLDCLGL